MATKGVDTQPIVRKKIGRKIYHDCPVCGFEKRTDISAFYYRKSYAHRKCSLGIRIPIIPQTSQMPKVCVNCGVTKPATEFLLNRRRGSTHSTCKKCECIRTRNVHLKMKFNITNDIYNQMLINQGGVCKICKSAAACRPDASLPVDHDHRTGLVRGILCDACNQGLGKFKDSPDNLREAARYLDEHEKTKSSGLGPKK